MPRAVPASPGRPVKVSVRQGRPVLQVLPGRLAKELVLPVRRVRQVSPVRPARTDQPVLRVRKGSREGPDPQAHRAYKGSKVLLVLLVRKGLSVPQGPGGRLGE